MKYFFKHISNFFVVLPFFWLATGMVWLPKGVSGMALMCLIAVIVIGIKYRCKGLLLNLRNEKFLWIVLAYLVYGIISYYFHGYSSRELKALFFSLLYLLFLPSDKMSSRLFVVVIILGGIGVCITSVYQYWLLDMERAKGFMHPNPFGIVAALFFVCLFSCACLQKSRNFQALYFALSALALIAVILSASRGVMLAVFGAFIILIIVHIKMHLKFSKKTVIGFIVFPLIACIVAYPFVEYRIKNTIDEIKLMSQEDYYTSSGIRLQVWKSAALSISKSPLMGLGDESTKEFDEQYKKGLMANDLYDHKVSHYHNQFIDKAIRNGLIGLLLMLLMIFYPFFLALKCGHYSFYKLAIFGVISIVVIGGFTDVPLNHAPILYFYLLVIMFLKNRLQQGDHTQHVSV